MKSLSSLVVIAALVSGSWSIVFAEETSPVGTLATNKLALLSSQRDSGLESALDALQKKTSENQAGAAAAGSERKHVSDPVQHKLHRIHRHGEDHILFLGGPEAFLM
jgi:hypothetical protein